MSIAAWYRQLRSFAVHRWVAPALIAINVVAGIVGGIYWYGPDMVNYAWWGWVFVPDCPLFTFLFAIALYGLMTGKKWTTYNAVTAVGLVKYGIWTVTVWILFWAAGYPATPESVIMTIMHVGMTLEGIVLLGFLTGLRWRDVLIAGGWFFLSDFMDYGLGFHPRMAPGVSKTFMMWEMIAVTTAFTIGLARLAQPQTLRVSETLRVCS
jgi:uncharacterized membrane protein YpjA